MGVVLGLGLIFSEQYHEKERQQLTRDLRIFFSKMGQIEVLYIDATTASRDKVFGGVIMADGRQYRYTYQKGQISFKENNT